jgi:hypothetical protein
MFVNDSKADRTNTETYPPSFAPNGWEEFRVCIKCKCVVPQSYAIGLTTCPACGCGYKSDFCLPFIERVGKFVSDSKFWHYSTWWTGHIEWKEWEKNPLE